MTVKPRQSNIELLRLISMLLIIGHHFSVHGGFYFNSPVVTPNMLFLQLLSIGGKIGVNLFVLISGHFLLEAETLRWKKVRRLWLTLFSYSVAIYAVVCVSGLAAFTWQDALRALLPVLSEQWWFASTYFALYLLSPAINRRLKKLGQKPYRGCLIGAGVVCCLVPVFGWLPEQLRNILWFVYLYSLAGYLKCYGNQKGTKRDLLVGALLFVLTFAYTALGLHFRAGSQPRYETVYLQMYHPLILLVSICLFRGFCALEMPACPRINRLAAVAFGVYLIHDSNYVRYPLWQGLLKCAGFADSPWLVPYAIAAIVGVYLVCGGMEAVRQALWRRLTPKRH